MFLFHLKSSFGSWDIQIFVFWPSPLFLPDSHCFRGRSKKNLEIYNVINCLNSNLKTHFVWYFEKEMCDIETLSIDRIKKVTFLWINHAENGHQKLAPDPFWILLNNPNSHFMQEGLLKIRYCEIRLWRRLKKVNFMSSFKPSSF